MIELLLFWVVGGILGSVIGLIAWGVTTSRIRAFLFAIIIGMVFGWLYFCSVCNCLLKQKQIW